MTAVIHPFPNARGETMPALVSPAKAPFVPQKKPAKSDPPIRTLDELLEESRRLEERGRELIEQAKALAAQVTEARARSENGRSGRQ
jgi:hypothetical protein